MNIIRPMLLMGLLFHLEGCSYSYVIKEHAEICWNKQANELVKSSSSTNGDKTINDVKFFLYPDISNGDEPISKESFWVRITGFTEGRRIFRGGQWSDGAKSIPMLYSTEFAYIEFEDGSRAKAEGAIYSSSSKNPDHPGEVISERFVDLNSDEIQLSNKHNWSNYGSIYVKFYTRTPPPTARWKLHLGKITLGDEITEIPAHNPCYKEGSSGRVWNSRP
jgi:hypothetical protein